MLIAGYVKSTKKEKKAGFYWIVAFILEMRLKAGVGSTPLLFI